MDGASGIWEPLPPSEVVGVLDGVACRWWIAGGWSIDLHLGRQSRAHADVDVLLLRADQLAVQQHLAGWGLHVAVVPAVDDR